MLFEVCNFLRILQEVLGFVLLKSQVVPKEYLTVQTGDNISIIEF